MEQKFNFMKGLKTPGGIAFTITVFGLILKIINDLMR